MITANATTPSSKAQIVFGAVTTGLLNVARPLSVEDACRLLDLAPGRGFRWEERPLARVLSPDVVRGLDCTLPAATRRVRGIGTGVSRALLTGGQVLQGSAFAEVRTGVSTRREALWSHYLARPGVVETVQKATPDQIREAWLAERRETNDLDLRALSGHAVREVRGRLVRDAGCGLKNRDIGLEWAVETSPGATTCVTAVRGADDNLRVLMLVDPRRLTDAVKFCEILALHDWLVRALEAALERSARSGGTLDEPAAALVVLGHLWMPKAHQDSDMRGRWSAVDAEHDLTGQWETHVRRIRDLLAVSAACPILTAPTVWPIQAGRRLARPGGPQPTIFGF